MCGSYKSDKKKYLELYSLHPEFRGKRFASALMRAVQDKLYADVRIFGVISSKNTKALINAEKTGRKTYATVYKYKGSLKDLNLYSSRASHYENIVMKEYLSGKDEHTLYELYNKNTPLLIAQIEAVAPEDFAVSFADRYISFIHRRLNKIIEKIFIIYYNRIKMLALSIKIMQNAHYAEIKVVGDLPDYRAGGYILAETLRKTYQAERLDNIYVYVLDYQHSILNSIKALNFTLDDEFCLVCNYEKFITMSR
jgi:hypothetical protein